jgi:Double sensory domain of two-component sensor kinase
MSKYAIRLTIIVAVMVVLLAGGLTMNYLLGAQYDQNVQLVGTTALGSAAHTFQTLEAIELTKLGAANDALRADPSLRALYLAGDRDKLYAATKDLYAQLKKEYSITHWYFIKPDPDSTIFLRVHKPAQSGDKVTRATYLKAVASKSEGAGLELGKTAFALRDVKPYYAADGTTIIGYLETGEEIYHLLGDMKAQTGDDYGMLLFKESLDASGWAGMRTASGLADNWNERKTTVLAASTEPKFEDEMDYTGSPSAVTDRGVMLGVFSEAAGRVEIRGLVPVKDVAGKTVGVVYVMHAISPIANAMQATESRIAWTMGGILFVITVVLLLLLNQLIFRRLQTMIAEMEDVSLRIAGGDFAIEGIQAPKSNDEIGAFQIFFYKFLRLIANTLQQFTADKE